jgi:GcrA cell cycle regulator
MSDMGLSVTEKTELRNAGFPFFACQKDGKPYYAAMNQIAHTTPRSKPADGRFTSSSPPPTIWPDARVEALTRAWREGLTASQIAARLGGGLSRCAVIGKLHRLGLCRGRKPSAPKLKIVSNPTPLALRRAAMTSPRPPPSPWTELPAYSSPISADGGAPPSGPGLKYLRDMARRECRFGLGDPGAGNGAFQLFCAAPTAGHAYCAHHRKIACLPPQSVMEQNMIKSGVETVCTPRAAP